MTRAFHFCYCLITTTFLLSLLARIQKIDFTNTQFSNLSSFLNYFSDKNAAVFIFTLFAFAVSVICLFKQIRILTILLSVVFISTHFIFYSWYGKIDHTTHLWMWSTLFMCFLSLDQGLASKKNEFVLSLIQTVILSSYFCAGLWKLRDLFFVSDFRAVASAPLNHIAYAVAEGNGPSQFISNYLQGNNLQIFIQMAFFGVLAFQLTSFLPIFFRKWVPYYGVSAVVFHIGTGLFMGIWFSGAIMANLFFMIFAYRMRRTPPSY